ncbi:hypothetical protein GCM10011366_08320 [Ornithinimicrobium tianjinense]|uniref:Uncharacterized protein n=1 Tax=Ornithinimicrobium tianjinense TaxID=1195761 RepID=A0A917F1E1_9MICO|nr:hypothetical protein GCM10011366_08320 [Ornithinimicrobium tianjinense]
MADRAVRDHEGRARRLRLGEHRDGQRQGHGRRLAHPGELAAADDADDGESALGTAGTVVVRGGLGRRCHAQTLPSPGP